MTETNAHIAPEPIEAPEPQREQRRRDLVRQRAMAWGWRVMTADPAGGTCSLPAFRAGVEAVESYIRARSPRGPTSAMGAHDRRARS